MKIRKIFKQKDKKSDERQGSGKQQRVYTYYTASKRQIDQFESSRPKQRGDDTNKRTGFRKLGQNTVAISFVMIVIVFSILMLFITSSANIKIVGEKNYNAADYYRNTINTTINGDILNRFKPIMDEASLESELEQKIPEATSIEVSSNLISRGANVKITTSDALAVFVQNDGPSYILDETGKLVVDINNTQIDTTVLSTMINESGLRYELGDQIFKPDEADAVANLHYQYTNGDKTKKVNYILPIEPRELIVKDSGYFIRYSTDEESGADITQQYGALKAVKKRIKDGRGSAPQEYIDVRLGDKIFVK